jgi:uncharacterized membrane protein
MNTDNDLAEKLWQLKLPVRNILLSTTVLTTVGVIAYLSYALNTLEDSTPSVSRMIEYSKGTTITFTLIVFGHAYGVVSYLVIASEYIGLFTWHFNAVAFSCAAYLISLIVVSYIPIDDENSEVDTHSVFALTAFIFALLSSWLHRHSLLNYQLVKEEWPILVAEGVFLLAIMVCGLLFWLDENAIAEYAFIFLIVIDKEIKIRILEYTGLLNVNNSFLVYTYHTPPSLLNDEIQLAAKIKTKPKYNF